MTPTQNNYSRARDERGTALVLAVVFVFIVGILIVSLGGVAANAFLTTSNARAQRTSTADAENAVTIAMQYLRYRPVSVTAPSCLPPSAAIPSSDPRVSTAHPPVQVYCTVDFYPTQAQTRVVEFYACAWGVQFVNCSAGKPALLLHAEVAYDDLNAQGLANCFNTSPPITFSCGMTMTVNTWDVIGADK